MIQRFSNHEKVAMMVMGDWAKGELQQAGRPVHQALAETMGEGVADLDLAVSDLVRSATESAENAINDPADTTSWALARVSAVSVVTMRAFTRNRSPASATLPTTSAWASAIFPSLGASLGSTSPISPSFTSARMAPRRARSTSSSPWNCRRSVDSSAVTTAPSSRRFASGPTSTNGSTASRWYRPAPGSFPSPADSMSDSRRITTSIGSARAVAVPAFPESSLAVSLASTFPAGIATTRTIWLPTSTVPAVGRSMAAINFSRVLLPAPEGAEMTNKTPLRLTSGHLASG